jgi:hypothetical protein
VGGGHFLHIVDFAVGGGASVIGVAVPTGYAGFGVADLDGNRRGAPRRNRRIYMSALLVAATGKRKRGERDGEECSHALN